MRLGEICKGRHRRHRLSQLGRDAEEASRSCLGSLAIWGRNGLPRMHAFNARANGPALRTFARQGSRKGKARQLERGGEADLHRA